MLYMLVALGIGLLISSWVKNQLVASQLTMLATFMPAFMLSALCSTAQYARGGAFDHICAAGTLLRSIAAVMSSPECLVGDLAHTLVLAAMAILLALAAAP